MHGHLLPFADEVARNVEPGKTRPQWRKMNATVSLRYRCAATRLGYSST
jgi:hypothetical protein